MLLLALLGALQGAVHPDTISPLVPHHLDDILINEGLVQQNDHSIRGSARQLKGCCGRNEKSKAPPSRKKQALSSRATASIVEQGPDVLNWIRSVEHPPMATVRNKIQCPTEKSPPIKSYVRRRHCSYKKKKTPRINTYSSDHHVSPSADYHNDPYERLCDCDLCSKQTHGYYLPPIPR